jgi:opacity protein-like surface antigen
MYNYVKYITAILAFTAPLVALAEPAVTTSTNDPMVMKVYPDGTKIVVRWSEIGKAVDNGEKHGGAPRIIAYDPGKDGIVPIGQPAATVSTAPSTPSPLPAASSVVTTESSNAANTAPSPMSDTGDYGPMEGFGLRSNVGVAFQQTQTGRTRVGEGTRYQSVTYQPGIRFDIEPFYNVTDWFSVGVESAFIYNQIHSIQSGNDSIYSRSPTLGSGALYQVPILANVRFQFPGEGPFRGFCGGGVGGIWDYSTFSADTEDDGNDVSRNYTNYQWNYAFQLVAGFSYNVAPGLDLETSFKTLCTPNPVGQANTGGSLSGNGQVNAAYSYAAEVGLVWRF